MRLGSRQAVLARVRDTVQRMRGPEDMKFLQQAVWEALRELGVPFRSCGINLINGHGSNFAIKVHNSDHTPVPLSPDDPGIPILRQIWQTGAVAYRRDLRVEDVWNEAQWMVPHGIRAVVDVPFAQGTLAVNSDEPDAFTPEHLGVLQEVAEVLSEAFGRIDNVIGVRQEVSEREIADRRRRVNLELHGAVWQMKGAGDIGVLLEAVRAGLEALQVPFSNCGINIVGADGAVHSRVVRWDQQRPGEGFATPTRGAGLVLDAWRAGEVLYRRDLLAADAHGEAEVMEEVFRSRIRSVLDVPFSRGTVAINSVWPNAFNRLDVEILKDIAQVLDEGFARLADIEQLAARTGDLERARAQLQETNALLHAFHEIAQIALAPLRIGDIVARLSREIVEFGIFRSLLVGLVDEDRRIVEVVAGVRRDKDSGELEDETATVAKAVDLNSQDILACVARSGEFEAVQGWDYERYAPNGKDPAEYEDKVAYFVPVKMGARVLAVLATGSSVAERAQTLHKIELMRPMLDQVAVALEKGRLYQELQDSHRIRDEEQRLRRAEDAVRLRIAEMSRRDDLYQVVDEIAAQLRELGVEFEKCSMQVVNNQGTDFFSFNANAWKRQHPFFFKEVDWDRHSSNAEDFPWVVEAWRTGQFHYQPRTAAVRGLKAGNALVDMPFSQGTLALRAGRPDAYGEREFGVLRRFAAVMSEGFPRYIDLVRSERDGEALVRAHAELERRVEERTAELAGINERLQALGLVRGAVLKMQAVEELDQVLAACDEALALAGVQYHSSGVNEVDASGAEPVVRYYKPDTRQWNEFKSAKGRDAVLEIWRGGEPVYRRDLAREDPFAERAFFSDVLGRATRSVIDVPFAQGTLALNSDAPDAFSPGDIELLKEMSEVLSVGFRRLEDMRRLAERNRALEAEVAERLQAETDLRLRQERLSLINELMRGINAGADVENIIRYVVQRLGQFFPGLRVAYSTIDADRVMTVQASCEPTGAPEAQAACFDLEKVPDYLRDLQVQRHIAVADVAADARFAPLAADMVRAGCRALLDVPLQHDQALLGMLCLTSPRPHEWSQHEAATLAEVGEYLAIATREGRLAHERAEIEEAARDQQERFQAVVDSAVDGVITVDAGGIIESVNRAAEGLFGYAAGELIGEDIAMLMPPEYVELHNRYIMAHLAQDRPRAADAEREVDGLRKDGSRFPMEIDVSEFRLRGRRMFAGIVRDISERKQLEGQLLQSQKMEAVGQLAGGVAHDINNILTSVNAYTQFLFGALDESSQAYQDVEGIERAGERAATLTRQLLAFSRRQVLKPQVVSLNAVIEDMYKMLVRLVHEDIDLQWTAAADLGLVRVDLSQVEQVVLNLVLNAGDAMPKGGVLEIGAANVEVEAAQGEIAPGQYVVLAVADTGTGMDAETQARIFEPFFTTKSKEKGTGLGLSTVYGIVVQSSGHIRVKSEVDRGTAFEIYFPRVEGEVWAGAADAARPLPGGSEKILLVEDQRELREVTERMLRGKGYEVVEAADGREALELLEQDGLEADLLLTDVVMPRMNGRELADAVQGLRPRTRVCFMSGYTDDAIVDLGVLERNVNFIHKPFKSEALLQKIREILDG